MFLFFHEFMVHIGVEIGTQPIVKECDKRRVITCTSSYRSTGAGTQGRRAEL